MISFAGQTVSYFETLPVWDNLGSEDGFDFNFKLSYSPADFTISIYDQDNQLVREISDSSDTGLVSLEWDAKDTYGFPVPGGTYTAQIAANWSQPQSGYTTVSAPSFRIKRDVGDDDSWPYYGSWVVAYQYLFKGAANASTFQGVFDGWVSALYDEAISYDDHPPFPLSPGGRNAYKLRFGDKAEGSNKNTLRGQRNADWADFRNNYVQNPAGRNLFLFSHGGNTKVGGDWNDENKFWQAGFDFPELSGMGSEPTESKLLLGNIITESNPVVINPAPYRFVFLDGCQTASKNWARAFGIPDAERPWHSSSELDLGYYQQKNSSWLRLRPSVYVGWQVDKYWGTGGGADVQSGLIDFTQRIMLRWRESNDGIKAAIKNASDHASYKELTPNGQRDWNYGIKFYGYANLTAFEYNYANKNDAPTSHFPYQ